MRPLQRPGWLFALALYAAAMLGCLILWLAADDGPTTATATATPTATATAEARPQTATATPTRPIPTATAVPATEVATTIVPTFAPTATPIPTATPELECRAGVITAHAAMEAVLANRPERRCVDCIYFASVLCQDIGERLTLRAAGVTLPVVVVDCATWSVGRWPQKLGEDWLGELDIRAWPEAPLAPLKAELCRTGAEYGASD